VSPRILQIEIGGIGHGSFVESLPIANGATALLKYD
jgi:hypothetical protein